MNVHVPLPSSLLLLNSWGKATKCDACLFDLIYHMTLKSEGIERDHYNCCWVMLMIFIPVNNLSVMSGRFPVFLC